MNLKRGLSFLGATLLAIGLIISCQSAPQLATPSSPGIGVGISEDLCPNVLIKVGEQLTWTNQGRNEHVVRDITVQGESQFNSGPLMPGDTFTITLSQPQSYKYECSEDGSLTGTVTIEP